MCRRRMMQGIAFLLFGAGLIIGSLLSGSCITIVVGIGLIILGLSLMRHV